ncbi:hypothetical protein [Sphingomonas sp.]|jgi:hypothetical protein|uniref:hypothetical protein n=1 Tax=Sphingomonas sp. TaxID=28214 RepID=UPI002E2F8A4D|nr:hypothetical protein [Sphingomonas sp.]HEX4695533.1 hypothetical protein [Sphingomonas sp.]
MLATDGRQRLISFGSFVTNLVPADRRIALPIAPAVGIGVAAIVALAFLVMPIGVLEDLAVDSGVAAMLTAAAPPLGMTARLAITFFAALAAGSATWFGMFLILGTRTAIVNRGKTDDGVPVLRRADAHPDAPPRRPVFANSDLGTPFLEVKAEPVVVVPEERDVPTDLDTPLAAFLAPSDPPLPTPAPQPIVAAPEPIAEPETIEPDPQAVITPLSAPRFAPHERIETFGLTNASGDDEPSAPLPQATIHDLLERLERGVRRQPVVAPAEPEPQGEKSLEETLDALRALARRVG